MADALGQLRAIVTGAGRALELPSLEGWQLLGPMLSSRTSTKQRPAKQPAEVARTHGRSGLMSEIGIRFALLSMLRWMSSVASMRCSTTRASSRSCPLWMSRRMTFVR
jgi:hypothetical protein